MKILIIVFFSLFICNASIGQTLQKIEVMELQERLLIAGYPAVGTDGILGIKTKAALESYAKQNKIDSVEAALILNNLRGSQSRYVLISKKQLEELKSKVDKLDKKVDSEIKIIDTKVVGYKKTFDAEIKGIISSKFESYIVGAIVFILGIAGTVYYLLVKDARKRTAKASLAVKIKANKHLERKSKEVLDRLHNDVNSHIDKALRKLTNESHYSYGNLAGRISLVLWQVLDSEELKATLTVESRSLIEDVYKDLKEKAKEAIMSIDEGYELEKSQHLANIVYYEAELYEKNNDTLLKNNIIELLNIVEPLITKEKENSGVNTKWAQRLECTVFANHVIERRDREHVVGCLATIKPLVTPKAFSDIIKPYQGISRNI